jgi:hypothetical protein
MLPKEVASKCALLMHTAVIYPNGTDLMAVKTAICPDYKVIFSDKQLDVKHLNFMYNMADVTVNIASNEGFGLSGAESLMAGTMIINNVTGGLQDHCRFHDSDGNWIEFTTEFPSNHAGQYRECGSWAIPVFPTNRSLQGSPLTPYIFDDRCDWKDVANAIHTVYNMSWMERDFRGQAGHDWVVGGEANMSARRMSERFIECIDICLSNWTPRDQFALHEIKLSEKYDVEKVGIL